MDCVFSSFGSNIFKSFLNLIAVSHRLESFLDFNAKFSSESSSDISFRATDIFKSLTPIRRFSSSRLCSALTIFPLIATTCSLNFLTSVFSGSKPESLLKHVRIKALELSIPNSDILKATPNEATVCFTSSISFCFFSCSLANFSCSLANFSAANSIRAASIVSVFVLKSVSNV